MERAIEDGMNFGFVDLDDDEVTEELEGYEASGAAEEVDMETADDEEMEEEEEKEMRRRRGGGGGWRRGRCWWRGRRRWRPGWGRDGREHRRGPGGAVR